MDVQDYGGGGEIESKERAGEENFTFNQPCCTAWVGQQQERCQTLWRNLQDAPTKDYWLTFPSIGLRPHHISCTILFNHQLRQIISGLKTPQQNSFQFFDFLP